jgi:hypothetical protein
MEEESMTNKLQKILNKEKENLIDMMDEYFEFKNSGILPAGRIRDLARKITDETEIYYSTSLEIVLRWACEEAAKEWLKLIYINKTCSTCEHSLGGNNEFFCHKKFSPIYGTKISLDFGCNLHSLNDKSES